MKEDKKLVKQARQKLSKQLKISPDALSERS